MGQLSEAPVAFASAKASARRTSGRRSCRAGVAMSFANNRRRPQRPRGQDNDNRRLRLRRTRARGFFASKPRRIPAPSMAASWQLKSSRPSRSYFSDAKNAAISSRFIASASVIYLHPKLSRRGRTSTPQHLAARPCATQRGERSGRKQIPSLPRSLCSRPAIAFAKGGRSCPRAERR
jgi:hypothetical protein